MLILYVFGLPFFILATLYKNKKRILKSRTVSQLDLDSKAMDIKGEYVTCKTTDTKDDENEQLRGRRRSISITAQPLTNAEAEAEVIQS